MTTLISRTTFTRDIAEYASRYGVDADLVEAVVIQESGGSPYAWNPEPHYRYLWDVRLDRPFRELTTVERTSEIPPVDFPTLAGDRDQEWWGQQASWGLMQIMGALGRELGFRGPYLPELIRPEVNLDLGTKHLGNLIRWANKDYAKALGAYNAGRGGWYSEAGVRYSTKVLSIVNQL